ncbi:MAG: hypothetical protein SFU86_07445 [Pirellulaceae bacterium]|nr:hypothetical protein [Pirellulaceae bacterium]
MLATPEEELMPRPWAVEADLRAEFNAATGCSMPDQVDDWREEMKRRRKHFTGSENLE